MSQARTEAIAGRVAAVRDPAIHRAGRVVGAAGALGLLGQLLFFDVGLGINFPIAMALLLGGGWLLRRRSERPPLLDAWLAPAALLFASFAAIRADPTIVAMDLLASLALAGFALASFAGRPVLTRSFPGLMQLAVGAIGWGATGAAPALADARHEVPSGRAIGSRLSPAMPVLRGLLLAIPVVLVFVVLFASADAVFARLVDDLFGIDLRVGDLFWRAVTALVLAWFAAGALALAASRPAGHEAVAPTGSRLALGTTELLTVLLAVDVLFAGFVALQAAYLFGGLDTLAAAGMTYAEYARRGFFELVAVAVLAGGLVVAADRVATVRTNRLVWACIGLALLTGLVLVSAAMRLRLYQEAYGWTELRLYVLATIGLLAVGVIGLVAALVADRVRWIGHLLVAGALFIGLVLNLIGPVRFITEQNVARVLDPSLVPRNGQSGLDVSYVASLGDDAMPALVEAIPALGIREAGYLRDELAIRLDVLRFDRGLNTWQAWNAGRSAARDALAAARDRGALP